MDGIGGQTYIIGVDPGRAKCGVAVLRPDGFCITRRIFLWEDLAHDFLELIRHYPPDVVVLGDRTGSKEAHKRLEKALQEAEGMLASVPIREVTEHLSSVEARERYLIEHRRGWRRYIPLGLQTPPEPYDDYSAEVLARRYLRSQGKL